MHSIAFFSEKVILSESGEKYAQIKHQLQVNTFQNSSRSDFDVRRQLGRDFSLEESYFGQKQLFKLKIPKLFVSNKHSLSSHDVN